MRRRRLVAVALVAGMGIACAWAEEPVDIYYPDHSPPGRPAFVVAPEYPQAALANGVTGYVDIEGRVDPYRKLRDVEYRPGSSEAEVFVPALREVLDRWNFYPVYGKDCMPGDERVSVRMSFEIEQGKPQISATVQKAPPLGKEARADYCPHPDYPRTAVKAGWRAIVYASVQIQPDGSAGKVDTRVYPDRGRGNQYFQREVENALGECKFPPPESAERRRVACYEIIFKLAND